MHPYRSTDAEPPARSESRITRVLFVLVALVIAIGVLVRIALQLLLSIVVLAIVLSL